MSINVGYFARESIQNFRRNWVMTLGAVITIYLSLLLVGVFLVSGVLVNSVVQSRRGARSRSRSSSRTARRPRTSTRSSRRLLADPLVEGRGLHEQGRGARAVQEGYEADSRDRRPARGQPAAGLARRHAKGSSHRRDDGRQDQGATRCSPRSPTGPTIPRSRSSTASRSSRSSSRSRSVVRIIEIVFVDHARDRVADLHQQHDPPRDLRSAQGDRHHASRRARATGSSERRSSSRACLQALIGATLAILSIAGLQAADHAEARRGATVPAGPSDRGGDGPDRVSCSSSQACSSACSAQGSL